VLASMPLAGNRLPVLYVHKRWGGALPGCDAVIKPSWVEAENRESDCYTLPTGSAFLELGMTSTRSSPPTFAQVAQNDTLLEYKYTHIPLPWIIRIPCCQA